MATVAEQEQLTGPPVRQALETMVNLATYHREHETYDAHGPLQTALTVQKASRVLTTLADRWSTVAAAPSHTSQRYTGCLDLNETATIQEHGVLFMEGAGAPSELTRLTRDLYTIAQDAQEGGQRLAHTMQTQMEAVGALLQKPALAPVLGARHRIILNDWQAAQQWSLLAVSVQRALAIVAQVNVTPEALRVDMTGSRVVPALLYAAAELIDRVAELASTSACLIHDNERHWWAVRRQVQQALAAQPPAPHDHGPDGAARPARRDERPDQRPGQGGERHAEMEHACPTG